MAYRLSKDIFLPCPVISTLPARDTGRTRLSPGQANLPEWHSVNCFVCPFFFQAVAYKKG